ncbi:putative cell division protein WhiA [Bienertia sinuspersici]
MQLDEICDTAKECFCATYATIVGIDNNMWYYDSCKQCNKKENKEDAYPEELNKLLDKKFLFRIHISKYNLEQNWNKYTVVRLTEDENTIKSFLEVDLLEEKDVEVESTKQKVGETSPAQLSTSKKRAIIKIEKDSADEAKDY